jgi:hypothetical protein
LGSRGAPIALSLSRTGEPWHAPAAFIWSTCYAGAAHRRTLGLAAAGRLRWRGWGRRRQHAGRGHGVVWRADAGAIIFTVAGTITITITITITNAVAVAVAVTRAIAIAIACTITNAITNAVSFAITRAFAIPIAFGRQHP